MALYTIHNPPSLLRFEDVVMFPTDSDGRRVLHYEVSSSFLHYPEGDNYEIFQLLGVDEARLLREAYGYGPFGGDWSESNEGDLAALTRSVWLLFGEALKERPLEPLKNFIDPVKEVARLQAILDAGYWSPCQDKIKNTACKLLGIDASSILKIGEQ